MSTTEERDVVRLGALAKLLENAPASPIGDILLEAIGVYEEIEDPFPRHLAEEAMRGLRSIASRANENSLLFQDPPKLPRELSDIEFLQLYRIEMTIHELCYCCEMVQDAADKTSGGSSPTRFYLNGIYHYTSSLFLVDTSKPSHKGLPMGGTVIKALYPMDLAKLLEPIKNVLDQPLGEITFGETILNLRHSDLVHGDFSPERVEYIIRQTQMRDPKQREQLAHFIWLFFHRIIVFHLQLLSLIADSGQDIGVVTLRYVQEKGLKK